MSKKMTVRFYQVACPDGVEMEKVLAKIKSTKVEKRTKTINKVPIRAHDFSSDSEFCYGDLVKIRMDNIPQIANNKTDGLKDILIADDEGLGEASAFLYHKETKILALQYNMHGVRESALIRYLKCFQKVSELCELLPVLNEGEEEKFKRMTLFNKLHVKLARGLTPKVAEKNKSGTSVGNVFEIIDRHDSPNIEVTLSLGHAKKGSTLQNITGLVTDLLSDMGSKAEVKKLEVKGKESVGLDTEVVDFISSIMKFEGTVKSGKSRTYPYKNRKNVLIDAWNKYGPSLIERHNNL